MALTPDTIDALGQALDAVVKEAGHDPQYADLVHALTAAQDALPAASDHPAAASDHPADHPAADAAGAEPTDPHKVDDQGGADTQSADDMFAAAQAQHTARRKGAKPTPPSGH